MNLFCVYAQVVDNNITTENLDNYGSVHDLNAELADDDDGTPNKQHCDGQTSITPPRHANDRMVGLYTRSEEAANMISDILRQDVVRRIQAGQLSTPMAVWEPRYLITPLTSGRNLRRLRARVYSELPGLSEDLIDELLEELLTNMVDRRNLRTIIGQVQTRAKRRL